MNEISTRCLDTFPDWLRSLADDALELTAVLDSEASEDARRLVGGGLTYLFKSLDLIPDGIEDLGFLDDAFVLRESARLTLAAAPELGDAHPVLGRLAEGSALVKGLLGEGDHERLARYVGGLSNGAARGRSVEDLVDDADKRAAFLEELRGWAASYEAPSFARDEKNIVKLQSFLGAKLPM
jgi:uncharacterized membrane protein YkvA (DUF1232 family)